jgi:hypothetical protein
MLADLARILLCAEGDRQSRGFARFARQINYGSVVLPTLDIIQLQSSELSATQSTSQQKRQNRPVPFRLNVLLSGSWQSARAFFSRSQFPTRTPSFFVPFKRPIPAACSGLITDNRARVFCDCGPPQSPNRSTKSNGRRQPRQARVCRSSTD